MKCYDKIPQPLSTMNYNPLRLYIKLSADIANMNKVEGRRCSYVYSNSTPVPSY